MGIYIITGGGVIIVIILIFVLLLFLWLLDDTDDDKDKDDDNDDTSTRDDVYQHVVKLSCPTLAILFEQSSLSPAIIFIILWNMFDEDCDDVGHRSIIMTSFSNVTRPQYS